VDIIVVEIITTVNILTTTTMPLRNRVRIHPPDKPFTEKPLTIILGKNKFIGS